MPKRERDDSAGAEKGGKARWSRAEKSAAAAAPKAPPPPPPAEKSTHVRPSRARKLQQQQETVQLVGLQQEEKKKPAVAAPKPSAAKPTKVVPELKKPAKAAAPPPPVQKKSEKVSKKASALSPQPKKMVKATTAKPSHTGSKSAAAGVSRKTLPVLVTRDLIPEVSGIATMSISHSQEQLAIGRENGSIVIFDVIVKNKVDHFVPRLHTGGCEGSSITRLTWTSGDKYLLAGLFSGQIIQLDAQSLVPVSLYPRSGGAIWDLCWAANAAFAAVADGQIHCLALRPADDHLEFIRAYPKISGATRTLCLAANEDSSLLVGADDGRNIVGWKLPAAEAHSSSRAEQQWTARLPDGVALAIAIEPQTRSVIVGTSHNDLVFLDGTSGNFLKRFSHHKGPVVCLCVYEGTVYASGWHELLRSYRYNEKEGEWFPAEAKRRTHYHEASAVGVIQKTGTFLSAARDGTLMHSRLHKLFNAAAVYVDCHPRRYATVNNLLARAVGKRVEVFKFDIQAKRMTPWVSYELKGRFFIKGIWFGTGGKFLAVATDERLKILQLTTSSAQDTQPGGEDEDDFLFADQPTSTEAAQEGVAVSQTAEYNISCISDLTFAPIAATGKWLVYASSGNRILWFPAIAKLHTEYTGQYHLPAAITTLSSTIRYGGRSEAEGSEEEDVIEQVMLVAGASQTLYSVPALCESGAIVGPHGAEKLGTAVSAATATPDHPEELILRTGRGFLKTQMPNAGPMTAYGEDEEEDIETVPGEVEGNQGSKGDEAELSLAQKLLVRRSEPMSKASSAIPPNAFAVGQMSLERSSGQEEAAAASLAKKNKKEGEVGVLGYDRGLILVNSERFTIAKKCPLEHMAFLRDPNTGDEAPLVIERNVDGIVEQLPAMWKVRRFAN